MLRSVATIWATATEETSSDSVAMLRGLKLGGSVCNSLDGGHQESDLGFVDRSPPARQEQSHAKGEQRDRKDLPFAMPDNRQRFLKVGRRFRG